MAKASEAKRTVVIKSAASVWGISTTPVESITLCIPSIPSKDFATDCINDFDVQKLTTPSKKSNMNNDINEDRYEDMYEDNQQAVLEGDQNEGEGKAGCKTSTMAQKRKIMRFVWSDSKEGGEREQKCARQESGSDGGGEDKNGAGKYSDMEERMDNEGKAQDNYHTNKDGDYSNNK